MTPTQTTIALLFIALEFAFIGWILKKAFIMAVTDWRKGEDEND